MPTGITPISAIESQLQEDRIEPASIQNNRSQNVNFNELFKKEEIKLASQNIPLLSALFDSKFSAISDFRADFLEDNQKTINQLPTLAVAENSYSLSNANSTPESSSEQIYSKEEFKKLVIEQLPNLLQLNPMQYFGIQFENLEALRSNLLSIIEEIVESVKISRLRGKAEILLELYPKELGKILLSIKEKEGLINIHIYGSDSSREIIESNLAELEKALKRANINMGELEVSSGSDYQANQQKNFKPENLFIMQNNADNNSSLPGRINNIQWYYFKNKSEIFLKA